MSTIILPYVYGSGTTYSAEDHADNLHSLTSGASIFGELNGGLTIDNFDADFEILAEHIIPGHAKANHTEDGTKPVVIVDNMLSTSSEDDEAFVALPGCAIKFYSPFDREACFLSWQIYFHAYDFVGHLPSGVSFKDIVFMAFFDGMPLYSTRSRVPYSTYFHNNGFGIDVMYSNEAQAAMVLTQSYMQSTVVAGYHTFEVRVWLERTRTNDENYQFFRGANYGNLISATVAFGTAAAAGGYATTAFETGLTTAGFRHDVYNRLTVGVRNVIVTLY
jgi:hypothetical protein